MLCSKFFPEIRDFTQRLQAPSILRPSLCGLATTQKRETCFVHTAEGPQTHHEVPLQPVKTGRERICTKQEA